MHGKCGESWGNAYDLQVEKLFKTPIIWDSSREWLTEDPFLLAANEAPTLSLTDWLSVGGNDVIME